MALGAGVGVGALLVEDHPLFRDGFAALLKHHRPDWTLDGAGSAAEALERRAAPDLAIIDIQLPNVGGFAILKARQLGLVA